MEMEKVRKHITIQKKDYDHIKELAELVELRDTEIICILLKSSIYGINKYHLIEQMQLEKLG